MSERYCPACRQVLPMSAFDTRNDWPTPRTHCRECRRLEERRRYRLLASDESWYRTKVARDAACKRAATRKRQRECHQLAEASLSWLTARGWTHAQIGREVGMRTETLRKIRDQVPRQCFRSVHERLAALVAREFARERAA